MILKLTLGSGETIEIPFSDQSTVQVTNAAVIDGAATEKTYAHSDVVAVELADDPVEEQPAIETQSAEQASTATSAATAPATIDQTAAVADTADTATAAAANAEPVEQAETSQTEPPAEDESLLDKVEDKLGFSHDDAVAAANLTVEEAKAGGTVDHVQAALADIETLLGVYPDSAELADAKAQLEQQLAGLAA